MNTDPFQTWAKENVAPNKEEPSPTVAPKIKHVQASDGNNARPLPAPQFPAALFVAGDLVRLRSGGPVMTVYAARSPAVPQMYEVEWFVGSDLRRDSFSEPQLQFATPAKNPKQKKMKHVSKNRHR